MGCLNIVKSGLERTDFLTVQPVFNNIFYDLFRRHSGQGVNQLFPLYMSKAFSIASIKIFMALILAYLLSFDSIIYQGAAAVLVL